MVQKAQEGKVKWGCPHSMADKGQMEGEAEGRACYEAG